MAPNAARKIAGARHATKRRATNTDPSKPEEPKDLIRVRNVANGRVYKFACGTCISGHRAPKCPPSKHRDKILFRRPEPGRPPRDCGHTKPRTCDCAASRNLCCNLTPQQWDEVIAGGIPSAVMYEDREALQQAERDAEQDMLEVQAREQAQAMFAYQHQQHNMPFRPAPPGFAFGQLDAAAQFVPYYPPYQSQPPYQPAYFGGQPAQTNFEQPQYHPQYQQFEQPPHQPAFFGNPPPPVNFGHPQYVHQYQNASMPVGTQALDQYAADLGRQEQMAAQPSTNPSQSCCSRQQAQSPLPSFNGTGPSPFNLPGPSPRSQFPCQSCASFQCTCITCPEVRQVSSGAWQQSCGRGGHIDNVILPKQEYSVDFPPLPDLDSSQSLSEGHEGFMHMLASPMPNQMSDLTATISQPMSDEDLAEFLNLPPLFYQQGVNDQREQ